jgi:hypothetical protein
LSAAGGRARYEVDEAQAEVVRQLFVWVALELCSIGEVCRRLQERAIPSPRGKGYWDRTTVWGILKNPTYIGSPVVKERRSAPLAIVRAAATTRLERPTFLDSLFGVRFSARQPQSLLVQGVNLTLLKVRGGARLLGGDTPGTT